MVEVGLKVFVSLDDRSYIPAGEQAAPPPPAPDKRMQIEKQLRVELDSARAS